MMWQTGVGQGPQSYSLRSAHGLLEKAQRAMFPSHLLWTEAGHIKSILSSPRFNPICHVHVHQPPGPPLVSVTPWVCHKALFHLAGFQRNHNILALCWWHGVIMELVCMVSSKRTCITCGTCGTVGLTMG